MRISIKKQDAINTVSKSLSACNCGECHSRYLAYLMQKLAISIDAINWAPPPPPTTFEKLQTWSSSLGTPLILYMSVCAGITVFSIAGWLICG